MRIAIDTLMAENDENLLSTVHALLEGLARIDQSNEYIIITALPRAYQKVISGPNMRIHAVKRHLRPYRLLRRQLILSDLLKYLQPDILHVIASSAPIGWEGPLVMTLPDLKFLGMADRDKQSLSYIQSYWRCLLRESARRTQSIIAISECTGAHLSSLVGVQDKIYPFQLTQANTHLMIDDVVQATLRAYRKAVGERKKSYE